MAPNDLTPCRMAFYFVSTFAIAQTPTKQPALRLSRTKNLHFAKAPFPGFSANEADSSEEADEAPEDEKQTSSASTKKKPGRKPFSDKLPREQIFIHLTDEEKEAGSRYFCESLFWASQPKQAAKT